MNTLTFDPKSRYLYNEDGVAVAEIFEDHLVLGNRIVEALRPNANSPKMEEVVSRTCNSLQAMLDGEDCDPYDMAQAMLQDLLEAMQAPMTTPPLVELAKQILLEEEQNPGTIPSDIVAGARAGVNSLSESSKSSQAASLTNQAACRENLTPSCFVHQDPLESVSRAYGEHHGLNANWSSRAWCVKDATLSEIWILDDETPSTVSLVLRLPDDDSVMTLASGTPDTILSVAEVLRGIIHLPSSNPVPTEKVLIALIDAKNALIHAITTAGFHASGPTDWRAAENNEPRWVCSARLALSYSRIVIERALKAST